MGAAEFTASKRRKKIFGMRAEDSSHAFMTILSSIFLDRLIEQRYLQHIAAVASIAARSFDPSLLFDSQATVRGVRGTGTLLCSALHVYTVSAGRARAD